MSDQEKLYVDDFLNSKREFIEKRTEEFLNVLISFEFEKKEIEKQIKIFRAEFKDDGVDINKVSKVFNRIKTRLRAKESDLSEEDQIEERLMHNDRLIDEIRVLISPIVIEEQE
jgi:cell division FtsZ-interacting protein ZapD